MLLALLCTSELLARGKATHAARSGMDAILNPNWDTYLMSASRASGRISEFIPELGAGMPGVQRQTLSTTEAR